MIVSTIYLNVKQAKNYTQPLLLNWKLSTLWSVATRTNEHTNTHIRLKPVTHNSKFSTTKTWSIHCCCSTYSTNDEWIHSFHPLPPPLPSAFRCVYDFFIFTRVYFFIRFHILSLPVLPVFDTFQRIIVRFKCNVMKIKNEKNCQCRSCTKCQQQWHIIWFSFQVIIVIIGFCLICVCACVVGFVRLTWFDSFFLFFERYLKCISCRI